MGGDHHVGTQVRHGWFEMPGIQSGEHTLKARIKGLSPLLPYCEGGTILDVGCAEGLIGRWLYYTGAARMLHGIDKHPPFLEMARKICPGTFFEVDLDFLPAWIETSPLQPKYDVVIALCIAQKMSDPESFIRILADRCRKAFVLHLPDRVIADPRSAGRKLDTQVLLESLGFRLVDHNPVLGIDRRIYERQI